MMSYFIRNVKTYAKAALPLMLGVGLGFCAAFQAQDQANREQIEECRGVNNRRVVTLQTVVGAANYCLSLYYLAR